LPKEKEPARQKTIKYIFLRQRTPAKK